MRTLDIIGIPIVEHCNLNCKGCLHFCHIGQKKRCYNVHAYQHDLGLLRKFFEQIHVIRIYGGEPLLHPEWPRFITVSKMFYPDAAIELWTNGLLLKSLHETAITVLKENNVRIHWSVYPILDDAEESICKFLKKYHLTYIQTHVTEFYTCFYPDENFSMEDAHRKCSGKHCHILRNGKLSPCPAPLAGDYVRELGGAFDFSDGILDLDKPALTSDQILTFLNSPHSACRHCGAPQYFPWQQQTEPVHLNDWYCM